jgi:hypothetical protein
MKRVKQIVFLLEEPSMKEFLDGFIPRAFPGVEFICVKHEGKQDLEKSIPRKLMAWGTPRPFFVIIRDNDQAQCKMIKRKHQQLCIKGGRSDTLIRIACQELESWYLGSLETLSAVYSNPALLSDKHRSKFRNPDRLASPSQEILRLIPEYRKIDGARRMGLNPHIDETRNRSRSFAIFMQGLRRMMSRPSSVS